MVRFIKIILLISFLITLLLLPNPVILKGTSSNKIYFVSDREQPGNYDIYNMDSNGANVTRLTTNDSIDNHPDISPDGTVVVFSSNRNVGGKNPEGDFELFLANPNNIDGTAVQLTSNSFPDRHPHFSPDGKLIVFDAKYLTIRLNEPISDQCSIPTPPDLPPKYTYRHEGVKVIYTKSGGSFTPPSSNNDTIDTETKNLDLKKADPKGKIWPTNTRTYIGHPTFNPAGNKLVFTGSVDGQGNNWEIYTANFNPVSKTVSGLGQITRGSGPTVSPNPIKMSGGSHFTNNGNNIIFTSTRNAAGYSHIYSVSATAKNAAVGSSQVTQLTSANANDYVPQQLDNSKIVFVSDRPDVDTTSCPPSTDLDIVIMNPDGSAPVNLTGNDLADEMLLIGDEVSWFCGIKPNLSECTYYPKIMKLSQFKMMYDLWDNLPKNFPFRDLYRKYKDAIDGLTQENNWRGIILRSIINTMHDDAQYEQYKNHAKVIPTLMGSIDNSPPLTPSRKSPKPKGAKSSFFDIFFAWSAGRDKDNNTSEQFTYDLYLGTSRYPTKIIAADLSKPKYTLKAKSKVRVSSAAAGSKTVLKPGKIYYWRVVTKDSMGGQKDGPVWSFKTAPKKRKR